MTGVRHLVSRWLNALWYGSVPVYWILWPVSMIYLGLLVGRRMAYRNRLVKSVDVGLPVIVVGNLTVGGTGKTPLTIWLARLLVNRGYRVGIVCRGYGGAALDWPKFVTNASDAGIVGDEARLLARRTGCPVAAGPDRIAAIQLLLESESLDIVLSDDGLQHYRLRRAFEFAVIDGTRGLGNGLCLPAGPLREPPSRLLDVDAVVINEGEFKRVGAFYASITPIRVYELATGSEKSLDEFNGQAVHAVAAIGNPGRFFDLLSRNGLDVEPHPLSDHADLAAADFDFSDGRPVLITEKDAVKCDSIKTGNVWCVVTELEFSPGDRERLERTLMLALERQSENQ
jgi:tetraacyldisaccharide 4'-kinase